MDELLDFLVKPVEGHPDVLAFRHDFVLEGKALEDGTPAPTVTEDENGDLIIEGWAASFEGLDRQGENFVPGAFQRGIKAFLEGQSALCFHHQNDKGIGSVLSLDEKDEGLWMKARVDFQPESSPLRYIYNAVKKGSYKGLSIGGFFKRAMVKGKRMIADMDFTEISVTPVAVHPNTKFAVVAGKALASDLEIPEGVTKPEVPEDEIRDEDFFRLQEALNLLGEVISRIDKRTATTNDTTPVEPV
jgi:HK97 family phage prohead protease